MEGLIYGACLLILMCFGMLYALFKGGKSWWSRINTVGIVVLIDLAVIGVVILLDMFMPMRIKDLLNTPIPWLMGAIPGWYYAYRASLDKVAVAR
ncbi:hypothetical protein F2P45_09205 [Massilia sp. CCM 8733]|uniref:Uncharacterized protein n=1 Tax=Massilia mucilaginosa TaxID=2609282 RepID=A0ABX0NQM9_9BURK|nr:hypothetical protein [Massilia mucilaginosa]NHZ89193.1 hypothetical protein [Massilia mucilaginosa]